MEDSSFLSIFAVQTHALRTYARLNQTSYANDDSVSPIRIISRRGRCGGEASVGNHAVIAQLQGMYPTTVSTTTVGTDVPCRPEQEKAGRHPMTPALTVVPKAHPAATAKPTRDSGAVTLHGMPTSLVTHATCDAYGHQPGLPRMSDATAVTETYC